MATITLTFTGMVDGTDQTISSSGTIPDNAVSYFFAALKNQYPILDANFDIVSQTDEQAFMNVAMKIAAANSTIVQNYINQQAIQTAIAAVPQISITPQ